ncbi:MAG: hypothetical protein AAGD28_05325 [Bacteroidota bacterium]
MFSTRFFVGLFSILILSLGNLSAQRAAFKPQIHELSLQLGSINSIPTLSDGYENGASFSLHPLNGVRYTYHYSISDGFRVGAFRRNASFAYPDGFQQLDNYTAEKTDWDFHLGYKRMYHMGQSQIYGGADLIYSSGKVEAVAMSNGGNIPASYSYNNIGASAFFGYSFFFNTHLSLTFEGEAYFTGIQNQSPLSNSQEPVSTFLLNDNEIGLNASVYLNFHLVKMKKRCTCPKVRI